MALFGQGLRLFVSYRRSDAETSAGRLFDNLCVQFGADRVFLDTAEIPFGEDFRRVVGQRIAEADVVLAVIGPSWATVANERGPRLLQEDDPVRFELRSALAAGKRVVPVLVGGAVPPRPEQLPEPLRALEALNMAPLRDASYRLDFEALVDELLGRRRGTVRRELDLLRAALLAGGAWVLTAPLLGLLLALAAWLQLPNLFGLDRALQHLLLQAAPPPAGNEVLLITIDAASERALGRAFEPARTAEWRADHARLVRRAAAAGARALAFDLVFERDSSADAELAQAIREAEAGPRRLPVVLGTRAVSFDTASPPQVQPQLAAALRGAGHWGSVCLNRRGNGLLWSAPLAQLRGGGAPGPAREGEWVAADTPALVLAALVPETLRAADLARRELDFDGPPRAQPLRFSQLRRLRAAGADCTVASVGDEQAEQLLRVSPPGHWREGPRRASYADALDPVRLPDARLAGKLLLVGATQLGRTGPNADLRVVRSGLQQRQVFGVELHADALAQLAAQRVPRLPTAGQQALTAVAAGSLGALAALLSTPWAAWRRWLALLGCSAAWLGLAWLLATQDRLLDLAYDLGALWLAWAWMRVLLVLARRRVV
jgi:CHASE2 domain-containing sensor protein